MNKLYNGLPLFDILIGEETDFEALSLVDVPAIERDFLALSAEIEQLNLATVDEEKHIVTGPAMIPEKPIYRVDSEGRGFYIKFSKESIADYALKFFADHSNTNGNLMHEVDVDGIVYFESYLVDKERGICPKEFYDLPDGTWIVSAKILNDKVWNLIKDGTLKGFSVQIKKVEAEPVQTEISTLEELINELNK